LSNVRHDRGILVSKQIKILEQPDKDASELRDRYLLRRFWKSAAAFWGKGGSRLSWVLSGTLLLIVLLSLATSFGMNVWNRMIFDALQNQDSGTVLFLSMLYLPLLMTSVSLGVLHVYARLTMQRRWRAWLNNLLIDRWLRNGRYYQLNLMSEALKNPEYRIADDVRVATESPVDFVTGATTALLSAATFVTVLWTIGGALTVNLGGTMITIPAFLVVAAGVYAVAASGFMAVIGRRFITVSENKNQAEAEYRYVLTRLRDNGESIALLKGEREERVGVDQSFSAVLQAWRDICVQYMRTTIVSQTSGYIAPILPIILCAPKFLDGSMTLGEVMQAASAFTIVQAAFNWLVDNYPRLAEWTASARRVASLQVSLDELEHAEISCLGRITRGECQDEALRLRNVSVTLDDGTAVLAGAQVAIMRGEKVLVTGESGSGKSALARALAGVWPWGEGNIGIAAGAKLLVLPQRPYVPIGTLRRAACYPDAVQSRSRAEIAAVFRKVGLTHLVERLDDEGPWDQTLSVGEKQRLAFARIFLHRPHIIVLDEATAALDSLSQNQLMDILLREFKETTVVSIGHRSDLQAFHGRKFVLRCARGGAKLVSDFRHVARPRQSSHLGSRLGASWGNTLATVDVLHPLSTAVLVTESSSGGGRTKSGNVLEALPC
jgi:vitamin B12/bleomycin/antimicrobial peptide transport system ATP-binding/permease protein